MADKMMKQIEYIMKKSGSKNIVIFTNHLKIDGNVVDCDKCTEGNLITLTNALVCRLEDYCACNGEDCECRDYVCFRYDWLHVNTEKISAFTFLKD